MAYAPIERVISSNNTGHAGVPQQKNQTPNNDVKPLINTLIDKEVREEQQSAKSTADIEEYIKQNIEAERESSKNAHILMWIGLGQGLIYFGTLIVFICQTVVTRQAAFAAKINARVSLKTLRSVVDKERARIRIEPAPLDLNNSDWQNSCRIRFVVTCLRRYGRRSLRKQSAAPIIFKKMLFASLKQEVPFFSTCSIFKKFFCQTPP